jgi:hypothetical protein
MSAFNSSFCKFKLFFLFPFVSRPSISIPTLHIQHAMAPQASNSWARFAFCISITLLFILSLTGAVLYGIILSYISHAVAPSLGDWNNFHPVFQKKISILPQDLNVTSSKLALASNVISLFISMCCVIFVVFFWPNGKRVSNGPIKGFSFPVEVRRF